MLLSNTRHANQKVDKRSLAANWLLAYHVSPPAKHALAAESRREAERAPEPVESGGWDPLRSQAPADDRGSSLQHARLLMLLTGARQAGTPYCTRTLTATWLMYFYMPESCRKLPMLRPAQEEEEQDGGSSPVAEAVRPAAVAEGKRRRGRGGGGKPGADSGTEGGRQQQHRRRHRH
mmetsp:Transcript_107783/g.343473  ORF Transcript_107783/g.343473 Transcript_107783/m.343473 type:complete len:177 (+) Transcript_107783:1529-2059(+)